VNLQTVGRKWARLTTNLVVRQPWLWKVLRGPLRFQFDRLAPNWDAMRTGWAYAPYEAALERVDTPRRALDLGTGTGGAAFALARRFPEAEVVGVDVSRAMIEQARSRLPEDLGPRVRLEVADASKLPYEDGWFDFVGLSNMIPFFDELERVTAPGGSLVIAFSGGAETPIYVPFDRLREELGRRGFTDFAEISTDPGTALLARKGGAP
jgi:SAM-dependent methyltransferase